MSAENPSSGAPRRRTAKNPLLEKFDTPHQTPPFRRIALKHYMPAFEEGIAQLRTEVDAIVNDPQPPTFENTVEALERSGSLLHRVESIFFALNHSHTSDQMEAIANDVQPLLTAVANEISHNTELFSRVKSVYDARATRDYDPEQLMLLERTYKDFVRSGTALDDRKKARFRELTTELGRLSLAFAQNVRAATNAYSLNIPLEDRAKIAGLPADAKRRMAAEARSRGEKGWTVALQPASYENFMMYCEDRRLRERLWRARMTLCYGGGMYDNRENTRRMASLRLELADLLGYATWADYVLENRMAENTATVESFLGELLSATKRYAEDEYAEIVRYADTLGGGHRQVMQWDMPHYIEKYRRAHYNVSDSEIKRYVRLDIAEQGLFALAERLYGIRFRQSAEIEVYHPDVRVFEVFDEDGSLLAVLYMDYYSRKSKSNGAWMTDFRPMHTTRGGEEIRPLVSCNFNFGKPARGRQTELSFRELETLLHEFGHALHGIFARGRYASLTGTNVYRDFVELPSQMLENWAVEKDFLDMWTRDEQGHRMPDGLIANIRRSKNFMAAYNNITQLSYALTDMAWHTVTELVTDDPGAFEAAAAARTTIIARQPDVCMSTAFTHIFGGGYAAGYYSYKWAEVLDADAYSLFEQNGIFDRKTAQSFRDNILSKGGSEPPMDLYIRFRGHKPAVKALIDRIIGDR